MTDIEGKAMQTHTNRKLSVLFKEHTQAVTATAVPLLHGASDSYFHGGKITIPWSADEPQRETWNVITPYFAFI
jgi:hypothetical protein